MPSAYVTTRRWPLLLVFDPGGRGARAAEVFREAAERYGWIVAASENARNGPWEPTLRAVNRGKTPFAWFGAAGHADFNFLELKSIGEQVAKWPVIGESVVAGRRGHRRRLIFRLKPDVLTGVSGRSRFS